jgi:hypothetical protein
MARPVSSISPVVVLKLDAEHKRLLNELIAVEQLNRSDIIRRAIRAYAKQLGVTVSPKAA